MNPVVIWIEPTGEALPLEVPQSENHSGAAAVASTMATYAPILIETLAPAIRFVVDSVAEAVKPRPNGPDTCEVKFGLKVSGEGHVILARMGSELSLEITVKWKREEPVNMPVAPAAS